MYVLKWNLPGVKRRHSSGRMPHLLAKDGGVNPGEFSPAVAAPTKGAFLLALDLEFLGPDINLDLVWWSPGWGPPSFEWKTRALGFEALPRNRRNSHIALWPSVSCRSTVRLAVTFLHGPIFPAFRWSEDSSTRSVPLGPPCSNPWRTESSFACPESHRVYTD